MEVGKEPDFGAEPGEDAPETGAPVESSDGENSALPSDLLSEDGPNSASAPESDE